MINNIVLVGRNTKAIELKQNKNGTNYVQFTLAVNRPYKDEKGGQQADFITWVAWNKTAETIANYVLKGMMIGIEGRLQVRSYSNEAGVRQYISEVLVHRFTFLESKKSQTTESENSSYPATETSYNPFDPNFSNPNYHSQGNTPTSQNYNNPFTTATTLVGSLNKTMNTTMNTIQIHDDDLPF